MKKLITYLLLLIGINASAQVMQVNTTPGALELLIAQPLQVVYSDYRSIMTNSPAIAGYTALPTQITTIANGNGAQKQTAIWIRDTYLARVANFDALYTEQKNKVLEWVKD